MSTLLLSSPPRYLHASYRTFRAGEHHITRTAEYDVLLLVLGGTLRFCEDGVPFSLSAGDYYIQRRGKHQTAPLPSERPHYLFFHFIGEFGEGGLPLGGRFSPEAMRAYFDEADALGHSESATATEQCAVLYRVLSRLYGENRPRDLAEEIAEYLRANAARPLTLGEVAARFHYGKNHVISLFRRRFGTSPMAYLLRVRLGTARHLLEASPLSIGEVAARAGFHDYAHFYRHFVKETGKSPRAYRRLLHGR